MIDPAPLYRKQLMDSLKNESFNNILEMGCGEAYNLIVIKEKYPNVEVCGVDIDHNKIEFGKTLIEKNNKQINLIESSADNTENIEDKSFDIVFTYALTTMVDNDLTKKIIENMIRIAKNKIIMIELDGEFWKSGNNKRFSRDYEKIFNDMGFYKINKKKIPKEIWAGTSYPSFGCVIKVTL